MTVQRRWPLSTMPHSNGCGAKISGMSRLVIPVPGVRGIRFQIGTLPTVMLLTVLPGRSSMDNRAALLVPNHGFGSWSHPLVIEHLDGASSGVQALCQAVEDVGPDDSGRTET